MYRKRILVTGGTGFIGSHLCFKLLEESVDLICMDNLFCSTKKHIRPLLEFENFEFLRQDVCLPFHVSCDEIYHLACPASPVHYQRNPVKTIQTATIGTLNALECARENNARLVITSTSEIYGDPLQHPQREDYYGNVNPIGKRSCYDEGKRVSEALAVSWSQQYNTNVRVARLFNTYGPKMAESDGRVIPNFITQARDKKKITVYGNGSQTRSFCYVEDTVDALIKLMAVELENSFDVVNIGNPEERTVLNVAQMIAKVYNSEIEFKGLPEDDPKKRKPDITKAKELLGWSPLIQFHQGMANTINYFDNDVSIRNRLMELNDEFKV